MINPDIPENSRRLAKLFNDYRVFDLDLIDKMLSDFNSVDELEVELKKNND